MKKNFFTLHCISDIFNVILLVLGFLFPLSGVPLKEMGGCVFTEYFPDIILIFQCNV